jgi:hypothetical protein
LVRAACKECASLGDNFLSVKGKSDQKIVGGAIKKKFDLFLPLIRHADKMPLWKKPTFPE